MAQRHRHAHDSRSVIWPHFRNKLLNGTKANNIYSYSRQDIARLGAGKKLQVNETKLNLILQSCGKLPQQRPRRCT